VTHRERILLALAPLVVLATFAGLAGGVIGPVSVRHGTWDRYLVTEYFPVPERWFVGKPVRAIGLPGRHAQDFLWSPAGLTMEFDGVLRDGRRVHFANDEGIAWVNRAGVATRPLPNGGWSSGQPVWRDVGWRNADGQPTFPKVTGGWSNGRGVTREPSPLRFALGPSEPFLRYWHTAAVDPSVIPFGSRIYVPAFRHAPNHGWFVAEDTGHTIIDHQVDLYLPPPPRRDPRLQFARRLRVLVVPPRSGG
jgi:hypothetical protein